MRPVVFGYCIRRNSMQRRPPPDFAPPRAPPKPMRVYSLPSQSFHNSDCFGCNLTRSSTDMLDDYLDGDCGVVLLRFRRVGALQVEYHIQRTEASCPSRDFALIREFAVYLCELCLLRSKSRL